MLEWEHLKYFKFVTLTHLCTMHARIHDNLHQIIE